MYRRQIIAPFTGGINTDLPNWMISEKEAVSSVDTISMFGNAQQRRGWAYDGSVADVASNLQSVYRSKYVIANVTRTMTTAANGSIYIHNAAGAGTLIYDDTPVYIPRAIYRDELLFCAQDGLGPMLRYSGAAAQGIISYTGTPNIIANEAQLTGMTLSSTPSIGSYASPQPATSNFNIHTWHRLLETSTTAVTMEGIRVSGTGGGLVAGGATRIGEGIGYTWPAVGIYSAGTALFTDATSNLDGFGTKWSTGGIVLRADQAAGADGVLMLPATGNSQFFQIIVVTDDDDLQLTGGNGTDIGKSAYQIQRRCNFTDVVVHGDSLFGTGNIYFPDRVYIGPPGWNPAIPPGFTEPFDLFDTWESASASDFSLMSVDVPSPYDGDVNIALLNTPNPVLVVKGYSLYGIYGNFPIFTVQLIQDDCGALDIRGCQNLDMGPVWAGKNGIFTYQGGRVIDLTRNRINREWRNLVKDFVQGTSTVTVGQVRDHLIVSVKIGGGGTDATYIFDIKSGVWISKFTNHKANYYFSTNVPGEKDEVYWVDGSDHQGRVMTSSTVFNNDPIFNKRDGDGTKPLMACTSGRNLSGKGPEAETTLIDMSVVGRLFDGGSAGSTDTAATSTSFDALTDTDGSIATGFASTSSTEATINAVPRRMYVRSVNNRGRSHFFSFSVPIFDTDAHASGAIVDIGTVTFTFEDTADRT